MRHSVFGKKLSRTKNERRRLLAGLARDLILRDAIVTTLAKAKAVQPLVEKLITKAKKGSDHDMRNMTSVLTDRRLTARLVEAAKTRFATRSSGFTRIVKLGRRLGDATEEARLSFVDENVNVDVIQPVKTQTTSVKEVSVGKVAIKKKTTTRKETTKKVAKRS